MSLNFPMKVKVGFQKREDTYNGKLAFVTYYNLDNSVKNEKAFNDWISNDIELMELDNTPQKGYILNKGIKRYSDFGGSVQKIRIHDPRGFEFEITIDNLIELTQYSDIYSQEISQECVLAWSGNQIYLVPTNSDTYIQLAKIREESEIKIFEKKEKLNIGYTYATKTMPNLYYLGKLDGGDMFFTNDRTFRKVSKSSIIAQTSNKKRENHDELLKLLNFVNITCSESVDGPKALKDEFKHIDVEEILNVIKDKMADYEYHCENYYHLTSKNTDRSNVSFLSYFEHMFRYSYGTIDGLEYFEFLTKHKEIFDKLVKNYTEESKVIFIDELRQELMKSKIAINTHVFPNGYCSRVKYYLDYIYVEGDDLETFLMNNKDFYLKEDMFLD